MSARVAPWKKPPGRPLNVQELTFTQPRRIFPQLHLGPDILVYWPDMSPDTWPLCRLTSSIRYQINGSILWPHSSSSTYYVVEPVKISDPSESNAVCWPSDRYDDIPVDAAPYNGTNRQCGIVGLSAICPVAYDSIN